MIDASTIPPQPVPDPDSEGFWRATSEGRLALCRCRSCRTWFHPPLERCRRCDEPTAFETVAGGGEIYSFIVVRKPSVPGYLDTVPYVVAIVELDEQRGLRLPGRVVGVDPDAVTVGMRVYAQISTLPGGEFSVAVFRQADAARPQGA